MNFKRNIKLYQTTTDNKTFKLCHYGQAGLCCMACQHRRRREWYHIHTSEKRSNRYPSWKLVSKNKKQWMKKKLFFESYTYWNGDTANTITW